MRKEKRFGQTPGGSGSCPRAPLATAGSSPGSGEAHSRCERIQPKVRLDPQSAQWTEDAAREEHLKGVMWQAG